MPHLSRSGESSSDLAAFVNTAPPPADWDPDKLAELQRLLGPAVKTALLERTDTAA